VKRDKQRFLTPFSSGEEFDPAAGIQQDLHNRSFFSRRSVLDMPLSDPLSDLSELWPGPGANPL
jgi:hypothetical protein